MQKPRKISWNSLQQAFEDKGLHRRLRLLRLHCSIRLEKITSMEQYVNEAMSLSQELAGLSKSYETMIMALENSATKLQVTL